MTYIASNQLTLPGAGAASVALEGLVALAGPLSSATAAPSVPGVLRISLEVSEDMPVTAQPAQLEEAPAGCADDPTSFSVGAKKVISIRIADILQKKMFI